MAKESRLASHFSGQCDDILEKDRDGCYFIDQPIELFLPLVNYLRAKACAKPSAAPVKSPDLQSDDMNEDFRRIVDYYEMTLFVFPVEISLIHGRNAEIQNYPEFSISSKEWATVKLQNAQGNSRTIYAYEIILGKGTAVEIGWVHANSPDSLVEYVSENGKGHELGRSELSSGLDCYSSQANRLTARGTHDGRYYKGSMNLDNVAFGEGTVIRSENNGSRWLVDGIVVASTINEQGAVKITRRTVDNPCLAVKGTVRFGAIEFTN